MPDPVPVAWRHWNAEWNCWDFVSEQPGPDLGFDWDTYEPLFVMPGERPIW